MEKVSLSLHCGRMNHAGDRVGHNDRTMYPAGYFNPKKPAEETLLPRERGLKNVYYVRELAEITGIDLHDETTSSHEEQWFERQAIRVQERKNARFRKERRTGSIVDCNDPLERKRIVDEFKQRYAPHEMIVQLGGVDTGSLPRDIAVDVLQRYAEGFLMLARDNEHFALLGMDIHTDEATPHMHVRFTGTNTYRNIETGELAGDVSVTSGLSQFGDLRTTKTYDVKTVDDQGNYVSSGKKRKTSKFDNPLRNFTMSMREMCMAVGNSVIAEYREKEGLDLPDIETETKDEKAVHRTVSEYKAEQERENALLDAEVARNESVLEQLQREREELVVKRKKVQKDIDDARGDKDKQLEQYSQLESERDDARQKFLEMVGYVENVKRARDEAQEKVDSVTVEVDEYTREIEGYNRDYEQLKQEREALKQKRVGLQKRHDEASAMYEREKGEYEWTKKRAQELLDGAEQSKAQYTALRDEVESYVTGVSALFKEQQDPANPNKLKPADFQKLIGAKKWVEESGVKALLQREVPSFSPSISHSHVVKGGRPADGQEK